MDKVERGGAWPRVSREGRGAVVALAWLNTLSSRKSVKRSYKMVITMRPMMIIESNALS